MQIRHCLVHQRALKCILTISFRLKKLDWTRIGLFLPLCAVNSSFGGARWRRHSTLAGSRRRRQRFHVCIRRAFEFASEATAEKNRRAPWGAH